MIIKYIKYNVNIKPSILTSMVPTLLPPQKSCMYLY